MSISSPRPALAGFVLACLLAGCNGRAEPPGRPPTAPAAAPATTEIRSGGVSATMTDSDLLLAFAGGLSSGDIGGSLALLSASAGIDLFGISLRMNQPLDTQDRWLADALGLEPGAGAADVLAGILGALVELGTTLAVGPCAGSPDGTACDVELVSVLNLVGAVPSTGTIRVASDGFAITNLVVDVTDPLSLNGVDDAFLRWRMLEEGPEDEDEQLSEWASRLAASADTWQRLGRPDVISPLPPGAEPLDVVEAYLAARNGGDWHEMVALTGGAALTDPFGTRDEFEAAQLLERDIEILDCTVSLETATSIRLACLVETTDIMVAAAGIRPTNPNRSSFEVTAGRVTALPQFIPSSFKVESAIEEWASTSYPEQYSDSCPDGIAGQSRIDGLACAGFIASHRSEWTAVAAAAR